MSTPEMAAVPSAPPFPPPATSLNPDPEFIERLPLAIYACDRLGRILWYNSRATPLSGRTPLINDDHEKYCGSYRLYFDGRRLHVKKRRWQRCCGQGSLFVVSKYA